MTNQNRILRIRSHVSRASAYRLPVLGLILLVALFFSPAHNLPVAQADSAPNGLVLWNTLGSEAEILNSKVGPDLGFFSTDDCSVVDCLVAYSANPEYVPGVSGNALSIGPGDYDGGVSRVHNVVLRNAQNYVNPERGTVEVWYKQNASGIPYQYGNYRVFDGAYGFSPGIVFGTNDLQANGHFVFQYGIIFGGQDIEATSLSNGEIGYDLSAYNGQWIHIAGVWDRNGIDGSEDTLRLYVNGEIVATATDNGWGTTVGPVVDIGGGNASEIAGKFAIDNLKLWNIAKIPVTADNSHSKIIVSDYEAYHASAEEWSRAKLTEYKEGDSIVFRFNVKADAASGGQVQVRFSGDTGKCMFFTDQFTFNTLEFVSGDLPDVSLVGAPTTPDFPEPEDAGTPKAEWVVTFNVHFDAAGEARVYHILQVSDQAAECKGFSHSRLKPITNSVKTRGSDKLMARVKS